MHDPDQLQIELENFPGEVRPMQAASVEAPFSSAEYLFEVKWDGLRCILFRDADGGVRLQDRGLSDLTADVPEVVAAAKRVPPGSVIDGDELLDVDRVRGRQGEVVQVLVVDEHVAVLADLVAALDLAVLHLVVAFGAPAFVGDGGVVLRAELPE